MKKAKEKSNAIEKALNILECFILHNNELGNLELSERLDYHRATTSRILHILKEHNFLYQNEISKKYSLGNKIIQLDNAIQTSLRSNIATLAHPYLLQLRDLTGQNIALDIIAGNSIVVATVLTGSGPVIMNFPVGLTVPWNTSPGVKSILAYADDKLKETFFRQPMIKHTANTIVDLDEYKKMLIEIKEKGYAYAVDEPANDVSTLSMPVFDYNETPVAAVSILGISNTISENKSSLLDALKEATCSITANVSFR